MALSLAIIGGTGFLGSSLLRRLATTDLKLHIIHRRTSDLARLTAIRDRLSFHSADDRDFAGAIRDIAADVVVFCATNYGRNGETPAQISAVNFELGRGTFDAAVASGCKAFLNTDTSLPAAVNEYAASKARLREYLRSARTDTRIVNLVLEYFYGPGDDDWKFPTQLTQRLLHREPKIPLTGGEQQRDFIYIDDAIEGIVTALRATHANLFTQFAIGSGEPVKLRDFVLLVKELTGNTVTELAFGELPYRANEPMISNVDTSQLRALGWQTHVSLEQGLRCLIESERSRISNVKR